MRLAYFFTLHHKFSQFRWVFDALYSPTDFFLIHVDKKSPQEFYEEVTTYIAERPNVYFLPRRTVNWGGWSQVAVELDGMKRACQLESAWSYFVNMSGQDYPIKCREDILKNYTTAWPRNFIRVWHLDQIRQAEPSDPHLKRPLRIEAFNHIFRTGIRLPMPRRVDIQYKGASWHALTREFCNWIVMQGPCKQIARSVKYSFSPDEVFFQAMIMSSPFRDLRTPDFGREVIWPGPKTLRMEDYPRLAASPALYARKFDESIDRDILIRLAQDYGYAAPRY
jgi:hypothetical protein